MQTTLKAMIGAIVVAGSLMLSTQAFAAACEPGFIPAQLPFGGPLACIPNPACIIPQLAPPGAC